MVKFGANQVAEVKDFSVNQSAATYRTNAPTTNDPAPAATFKAGETSWEASVNCYWDDTDTNGQEAATIGANVTAQLMPEGAATGDADINGSAIVTGLGIPVAHDGIVERSITMQGTGPLTHGTAV